MTQIKPPGPPRKPRPGPLARAGLKVVKPAPKKGGWFAGSLIGRIWLKIFGRG